MNYVDSFSLLLMHAHARSSEEKRSGLYQRWEIFLTEPFLSSAVKQSMAWPPSIRTVTIWCTDIFTHCMCDFMCVWGIFQTYECYLITCFKCPPHWINTTIMDINQSVFHRGEEGFDGWMIIDVVMLLLETIWHLEIYHIKGAIWKNSNTHTQYKTHIWSHQDQDFFNGF